MSATGYNPKETSLVARFQSVSPPTRFYNNVNRDYLKQALNQMYICNTPYVEFSHILRHHRLTGVSSESLSKLFNDVRTISVDSLEGNVFISGEQYVDEMLVVKYNKPRQPGSPVDPIRGLMHEYAVGTLLNQLRDLIPNFMYVYDHFECEEPRGELIKGASHRFCEGTLLAGHICTEFLRAKPLEELALEISPQELGAILLALFCSLEMANAKFGYCHYDLHAKNVMVREEVRPISVYYPLGVGISVTSKYIPVVIDYGFSRVVFEGETYSLKLFSASPVLSHPRMYEENHPFTDFHKLTSHLITTLFNKQKFTPGHRDLFEQWGEPLREYFSTADYQTYMTIINMPNVTALDGDRVQRFLERTYYKSVFYPTMLGKDCTFLQIATPLLRYKDAQTRISKCSSTAKVFDRIYALKDGVPMRVPCNGEVLPLDKYGNKRVPIDCAKRYVDGTYQVAEFSREYRFYQGSPQAVAANWWVNPSVESSFGTPIMVFTDRETALTDSIRNSRSDGVECGDKCLLAFQFKSRVTLFNLSSHENIEALRERVSRNLQYLLFVHTSPNEIKPGDTLSSIVNVAQFPTDRFQKWMKKRPSPVVGLAQLNYALIRLMLNYLEPQGYQGIVLESPFTIFLSERMKDKIQRYYGDPRDWQFSDDKYVFGMMGRLMRDLAEYKTVNEKQAGDLLQHSVWTALFAQWMFRHGYPSTVGLEPVRKTLLLTAFMHDIGEGGDMVFSYMHKPDHHERGAAYIVSGQYLSAKGVIDLNSIWKEVGIPVDQLGLLRFTIKYAGVIGGFLDKCEIDDCSEQLTLLFLKECDANQVPATRSVRARLFNFVYTVWVANVMASQPFINREKLGDLADRVRARRKNFEIYFNDYVEDLPMLTNLPRVRAGVDEYEKYKYAEKDMNGLYKVAGRGESLRQSVIKRIEARYP